MSKVKSVERLTDRQSYQWEKVAVPKGTGRVEDRETWKCYASGNLLKVRRGTGLYWEKWINGHYRGMAASLIKCQMQLEREVRGEGDAWNGPKDNEEPT